MMNKFDAWYEEYFNHRGYHHYDDCKAAWDAALASCGLPEKDIAREFKLSDDQLMTALRKAGLSNDARYHLFITKWKDGIDICIPSHHLQNLAKEILAEYKCGVQARRPKNSIRCPVCGALHPILPISFY